MEKEVSGQPKRLPDIEEGKVLAFLHDSYESATDSVFVNENVHGHPAWVEETEDGWISVVDLRPAIAEIEKNYREAANVVED